MQTGRDREWWQRAVEHVAIALLAQQAALQDALGQFLYKQRHAIGAIGDLGDHLIGQRLAAGDLLDQKSPSALVKAIERQHRHLRLAAPSVLKFGAESDNDEEGCFRAKPPGTAGSQWAKRPRQ